MTKELTLFEPLALVPARQTGRNVALPPRSRLVAGVKGDYYVVNGRCDYHPCFEQFWHAYPRRVEKHEAYGVWLALDPDRTEQEAIIAGALRYAANPYTLADGKQYIPYPSRWLQRRRWLDEDDAIPVKTREQISEHLELNPTGRLETPFGEAAYAALRRK